MIRREDLEAIVAKCPVCGEEITRDHDGCIQCHICLQKARETGDWKSMAEWWRQVNHIQTWVLDGRKIQSSTSTARKKDEA